MEKDRLVLPLGHRCLKRPMHLKKSKQKEKEKRSRTITIDNKYLNPYCRMFIYSCLKLLFYWKIIKLFFFRSQMGKSLCEHKEDSQCVKKFSWILDPIMYKDNPQEFKPCERDVCRNVLSGHSSLHVPIRTQNGHKPYEYQSCAKLLYEWKDCRNNLSCD